MRAEPLRKFNDMNSGNDLPYLKILSHYQIGEYGGLLYHKIYQLDEKQPPQQS